MLNTGLGSRMQHRTQLQPLGQRLVPGAKQAGMARTQVNAACICVEKRPA